MSAVIHREVVVRPDGHIDIDLRLVWSERLISNLSV
jgi:hypothetical protein